MGILALEYLEYGKKAMASYGRSLELNPENQNAVQAIERLEASE